MRHDRPYGGRSRGPYHDAHVYRAALWIGMNLAHPQKRRRLQCINVDRKEQAELASLAQTLVRPLSSQATWWFAGQSGA